MTSDTEKKMGWEVAHDLEADKNTIGARFMPEWRQVRAALGGIFVFFLVFLLGMWLAGNPFEPTVRIQSDWTLASGLQGNEWRIIWSVVFLAAFFEFMDASAGMGFGTALTPILLVIGFDPRQIVPVVMIQQGVAGLVGAFLHREFENVEWKFSPMSETVRLWLIIAVTGCIAVSISIFGVYKFLHVDKIWIKLYVAMLLLVMGGVSVWSARKDKPYKPNKMIGFAALAGFNKGVGGGGYGPVVTIGGLMSGVPVKSMLAVTAICEGTVSTFAIIVWLALLTSGVQIDYLLLPSFMIATMFSAVAAPYMTRVFPEKLWKIVVPTYCLLVAAVCFYKIGPGIYSRLIGG
ncbi:MAG: sulfite exporter TauE/SafE family protein [Desulfobacula sp.]|uniref:sulfite exporter TauE/SafE family protein n=1 Tax=Desulfobacula sp. TaxID=2593537 RepID=UPI0025C0BC3B|nr:sulfite exporter TauE/SafE family protein [Desulfobacula sp.]MCD4719901.1 sulfite exporter TauE/SafE family protein [Desulfobacula sp.]